MTLTLKFNRILEIVEVHLHAKFRQAKCSGSGVIVFTEKKTQMKTILSGTAVDSKNKQQSANCFNNSIMLVTVKHTFVQYYKT